MRQSEFDQFYDETYKGIYRFFYYRGLPKHECEDLMQEAFVRLLKGYPRLITEEKERAKKILYGIAKNLWVTWLEEHKKLVEGVDPEIFDIEGAQEDDAIDALFEDKYDTALSHKLEQLKRAIKNLNPVVKDVITLKFLKNYTRAEIAKELGITEDNVHTYQKRGVKYLKKALVPPNLT